MKNLSGDDIQTLSVKEWLLKYGRRSSSIFGSSETVEVAVDDSADDGMAMMMILVDRDKDTFNFFII